MFWTQTSARHLEPAPDDESEVKATGRPVPQPPSFSLEKVEPVVARFLGMETNAMKRHFQPANREDLEQILALRQNQLDDPLHLDRRYLQWRYRFSARDPMDAANQMWAFKREGKVLGVIGVERASLALGGGDAGEKQLPALKIMDLLVRRDVDRKGLGLWMILQLQSQGLPIVALGSNHNSLGLVTKVFQRLANQKVYKSLLDSRDYFATRFARTWMAKLMAAFYDANLVLFLGRQSGEPEGWRQLRRFGPQHDGRLEQMHASRIHFRRCAKQLNWRLFHNPRDRMDVRGFFEGEQLAGYWVFAHRRCRGNRGSLHRVFILDWGFLPGRESAMVRGLVAAQRRFRRDGVESISAFAYNRADGNLLRRAGLRLRDDQTKTVSLHCSGTAKDSLLLNSEQWFLTGADTDYA